MNSDSPNTADIVERLDILVNAEGGGAMADAMHEAAAIITELKKQRVMILAAVYGEAPTFVATISDEMDHSGALLGKVRELARAALKDHRKAQAHEA